MCQDATQWTAPNHTSKQQQPWHVILCDVPCSGDATIRKDAHILPMWKPSHGHALHGTQLQLLLRALQLVAPKSGVVSYSACGLNPIENEAVVAAAIRQFNEDAATKNSNKNNQEQQPAVELIDFPKLPGFHKRPGVATWRVADILREEEEEDKDEKKTNHHTKCNDDDDDELSRLQWCKSYQDAVHMEHAAPSMWPPPQSSTSTTPSLHLERCTRLWPQDHDSGGFFVALLRRNW